MSRPVLQPNILTDIEGYAQRIADLERALAAQTPPTPPPAAPPISPLNFQDIHGSAEAYTAFSGTGNTDMYATYGQPLALTYTPPVNCWWDVTMNNGVVQKTDAAYHYLYGGITLDKADENGVLSALQLVTQHSAVNTYEARSIHRWFKLKANTTYTVKGYFTGGSGGSWQYFMGSGQLWLQAVAWQR